MALVEFYVLVYEFYELHFYEAEYLNRLNECQAGTTVEWAFLRILEIEFVFFLVFIDSIDTQEGQAVVQEAALRLQSTEADFDHG